MRLALIVLGIVFMGLGIYYLMQYNQPVVLAGEVNGVYINVVTDEGKAAIMKVWDVVTGKTPKVREIVLNSTEPKEVKVIYGTNTTEFVLEGSRKIKILPQPTPTPIIVDVEGRKAYIFVGPDGSIYGASFDGVISVGTLSVSEGDYEKFRTAVLTYTLVPFIAGLSFTLGGFMIGREKRGRR
jgi:hypothetical protein